MTYKYAACQLYSVAIAAVTDPETGEPVKAVCNENNKTATLVVPANTDLTKLVPKFELSPESFNASFDKPDGKAYDFTEPVQFTVTFGRWQEDCHLYGLCNNETRIITLNSVYNEPH